MTVENTTRDVVKLASENPAVRIRALKLLPLYISTLPSKSCMSSSHNRNYARSETLLKAKVQLLHESSEFYCWKYLHDCPSCYKTQCIDTFLHRSVTMTIMEVRWKNKFHYTRGEIVSSVYAQGTGWKLYIAKIRISEKICVKSEIKS